MYIKVKVIPESKREVLREISSDHIELSIREKAENNRANTRLLEILYKRYPHKSVKIISGHHSRSKIVSID